MSFLVPKRVKATIAQAVTMLLRTYAEFDGYRVHRVTAEGATVTVVLKRTADGGAPITHVLSLAVKETV